MNIYDLAREANVSIATASKALNGRRDVNEQTRQRVLDTAKRINYHPSHLARGLASRRTENIGILIWRRWSGSFFINPFYSHVLEGIEGELAARNYNMVLGLVTSDDSEGAALPKMVREKGVDGLVLLGEAPKSLQRAVQERRLPSVVVDTFVEGGPTHHVLTDNRGGMQQMVAHLAGLGHKKLALVTRGFDWSFVEREAGFAQACTEAGLQFELWPWKGELADMRPELIPRLQAAGRPTAILGVNDTIALSVMSVARELGLAVPDDISFGGFDDIDAAATEGLSTLRVDKSGMGRHAIQRIFRLMEPPLEAESREDMPVELVVRRSTGSAKA